SCSPCHSFLFHLLLLWSPLFPYTTLFRSQISATDVNCPLRMSCADLLQGCYSSDRLDVLRDDLVGWGSIGCRDVLPEGALDSGSDRKSTRLNSSHQIISYAVFCLKKKTVD